VAKEGEEEAGVVAEIAAMCVSSSGEDRPTMKQVEMRLEVLQSSATSIKNTPRTGEHVVNIPLASMEREILMSMDFPR
jgi:hypothetical protein